MKKRQTTSSIFKAQLEKICEVSGTGCCPGCGLTPEALDVFLQYAYELGVKHSKETSSFSCVDCGSDVQKHIAQCDACRREV